MKNLEKENKSVSTKDVDSDRLVEAIAQLYGGSCSGSKPQAKQLGTAGNLNHEEYINHSDYSLWTNLKRCVYKRKELNKAWYAYFYSTSLESHAFWRWHTQISLSLRNFLFDKGVIPPMKYLFQFLKYYPIHLCSRGKRALLRKLYNFQHIWGVSALTDLLESFDRPLKYMVINLLKKTAKQLSWN